MQKPRHSISRPGARTGVLLGAFTAYILLVVCDVIRTRAHLPATTAAGPFWFQLGFSELNALLFLAAGGLAWQYARQRAVGGLLFAFCLAVAVTFAVETGSIANDFVLNKISSASSELSFALLSALFFFFPRNLLAVHPSPGSKRRPFGVLVAWGYLALLVLYCAAVVLIYLLADPTAHRATWFHALTGIYDAGVLLVSLATAVISYLRSTSARERQQMRFLVAGVILAVAPLLILTVLPPLLGLPAWFAVDGQISSATIILLPIALVYSVLRYQLLVADRYIRRVANWIASGMLLVVLIYLVVVLSGLFLKGIVFPLCVAALTAVLVGVVPRQTPKITEGLFFREFAAYRRHLQDPDWYLREAIDYEKATELLSVAFMDAFGVPAVAIYIIDEEQGSFRSVQGRSAPAETSIDVGRAELVRRLAATIRGEQRVVPLADDEQDENREVAGWIQVHADRLAQAKRPLFVAELGTQAISMSTGLARYFNARSVDAPTADLLVIPVCALGKLIALLLMGERSTEQPWAGPDFEVMRLLLARFTPVLSTCLLAARALRLEAVAATDPLTRLPNHRSLVERLGQEISRSRRYGRPLSLVFFDGDHFKRVNDTHGHAVGDAVLRELGARARCALRAGDVLGRYGGEEFLAVLPETDAQEALTIAERMRAAVAAFPLVTSLIEGGHNTTISVGVSTFPADGATGTELLEVADQAMYWAKRLGRNQVRTPDEARRAMHNAALAATISSLERRDEPGLDGLNPEQLLRADQAALVYSLMRLLDLRDSGISSHSYQVSDLAAATAKEMGLNEQAVIDVATAALLHDIGKIGVPDAILKQAGPLSAGEWSVIREHPEQGALILEDTPALSHLARAVRGHHERWDGSGYPAQAAGSSIPLEARIIGVAEAYHAMLADRPYQAARSKEEALAELARCAGTHFDPRVVVAALAVLARELAPREAPEPAEYHGA
jgi:diguanylate cyclase (GGDEF)-like protein/putative nucleotidyltransferase with HDIG domain